MSPWEDFFLPYLTSLQEAKGDLQFPRLPRHKYTQVGKNHDNEYKLKIQPTGTVPDTDIGKGQGHTVLIRKGLSQIHDWAGSF
jgi:hypothetical protein